MNRRICYLSASRLDTGHANCIHVVKMCDALSRLGFSVTLASVAGGRWVDVKYEYGVSSGLQIQPFRIRTNTALRPISHFMAALNLRRKIERPALWYARNIYAAAAIAVSGEPIVLELHDIHRRLVVRKLIDWILRRPNVRGVVVISKQLKEDCLQLYRSLRDDMVLVAPDAADCSGYGERDYALAPGGVFEVGYVGSLYPGKGMEIVSQLASRMQGNPRIRFNVVGGDKEDLKYWKNAAPYPNIIWHGKVSHGRVPRLMAGFHVSLLPNQEKVALQGGRGDIGRWTSPLKMFEYMASGLPIIASDLPILREVLTHKVNSLLCDPRDTARWEEALLALLNSADLRASLGKSARHDFLAKYTWTKRAQRILANFLPEAVSHISKE
jgi:glycosyltransferase involved in cell wall biosynthesis